jgi:membrane associated rhomboid family serine protease
MQRNFSDEIKYQWQYGGALIRLIGINLVVFLLIGIITVIGRLYLINGVNPVSHLIQDIFTLYGKWEGFIYRPWGLFTSIFAHFDIWHFLFNMIFLYFVGQLFLRHFSQSRMVVTYLAGGVLGGLVQMLAYSIFPALQGYPNFVVGASGSVMAIFMAVAFYRPQETVFLFGLIRLRIIYLALFFLLVDFMRLGEHDNVAHFAHLGGAGFGIWSIQQLHNKNNIVSLLEGWWSKVKGLFQPKPHLKVKKGGKTNARKMSDYEFNEKKKREQEIVDRILDKISKSGYDSLTKEEKAILFDQSKNG